MKGRVGIRLVLSNLGRISNDSVKLSFGKGSLGSDVGD